MSGEISFGEYINVKVSAGALMLEVIAIFEKMLARQNGQPLPLNLVEMRDELRVCLARAAASAGVSAQDGRAETVLTSSKSPAAAAKALGIKPGSVRWACRNGLLGTRIGDRWLITDEEIEDYRCKHLRSD